MDIKETVNLEDLDVDGVAALLEEWKIDEFVEFVKEKDIDGRKLLELTEGTVKLWRPKANAKKFLEFIATAKLEPDKYLKLHSKNMNSKLEGSTKDLNIEAQYQTVKPKRSKDETNSTSTNSAVEDILKRITPAKSFLYKNQPPKTDKTDKPLSSYVPMDASQRKPKRFFRLSSYEYPHFDLKQFRFSKTENFNDRGYYSIKTDNSLYIQKTYKKVESKTKYKSLSTPEELENYPEEHFYEDLNYNEIKNDPNDLKELNSPNTNIKPRMVKIQELFSSFKIPFFKRNEELEGDKTLKQDNHNGGEKDGHIYENSDSAANMYDSIDLDQQEEKNTTKETLPVEDYLEPVQLNKDYCDVERPRDESILSYILSLFESLKRRETTETQEPDLEKSNEKPVEERPRSKMADRPLPVPVESEPYYMDIDRTEAENLLRGQPDGTFILRPSSQPDHAYTLTVSCAHSVHNVGIRKRPDGRLALGFARKAERSFDSVTSLLRHHRKQRLLLVAGGVVCGATALVQPPQYYQSPSELPRPVFQALGAPKSHGI